MSPRVLLLIALAQCSRWSCGPAAGASAPVEVAPERIGAGLVAEYRAAPQGANGEGDALWRIEAKPALTLRSGPSGPESLHPALPPGGFQGTWTGLIDIRETSPIRWGAYLCGTVKVTVGGVAALEAKGTNLTSWVEGSEAIALTPGLHRLAVEFQTTRIAPGARLQLWWEGDAFAREPLPAWRLKHVLDEEPLAVRRRAVVEHGRDAVSALGCVQCHRGTFLDLEPLQPGPSLHDVGQRVSRAWLDRWLADPTGLRPGARMPALFAPNREGRAEARLVGDYLIAAAGGGQAPSPPVPDHRPGRNSFLGLGCVACHLVPDIEAEKQAASVERTSLRGLRARFNVEQLAAFLNDPRSRYPDGRMPRFMVNAESARELAAYLLTFAGESGTETSASPFGGLVDDPTPAEIASVVKRLGLDDAATAGRRLWSDKGCARCHPGVDAPAVASIPIRNPRSGCLTGEAGPRFHLSMKTRDDILAFLEVRPREGNVSAFAQRQRRLDRAGCARCHARDTDAPAPLEAIGRELWTSHIARLPYQRTPPLTQALEKYHVAHLLDVVRDGVSGLRPAWYSYRMPTYGPDTTELVRALAEADGDLLDAEAPASEKGDPDLITPGRTLVGFEGYGCVACHMWKGRSLAEPDPSAVGPDLSSITRRVRREWFDRWLEDPQRLHPGTPMPSFFARGAAAGQREVLGGDGGRQKEAIWTYLANAATAPSPEPRPSQPVTVPPGEQGPLVAQIPIDVPGRGFLESISILTTAYDLLIFDVGAGIIRHVFTSATILRNPNGNRSYSIAGRALEGATNLTPRLVTTAGREMPGLTIFRDYLRQTNGARLRVSHRFPSGEVEVTTTIRLPSVGGVRAAIVEYVVAGVPVGNHLEMPMLFPDALWQPTAGVSAQTSGLIAFNGAASGTTRWILPPSASPNVRVAARSADWIPSGDRDASTHGLSRPGYRAVRFPMPKTAGGEDLVMPMALAVDPRDDRLFVASLKQGEVFTLDEPRGGPASAARFRDYAHGLFQDALAMQHDGTALHVLHRRNLTRITDVDQDGQADRFERLATFPHAVGNAYDWGYGLVREPSGAFLVSFAPHANQRLIGSGSVLRLTPGAAGARFEEVAWGFRNPLGWCAGPDGEVFFTDNQGEWTATSKLGHLVAGSFNGYPNHAQLQHTNRPFTPATVWVPYDWARSINGMAWENTGGKFGPFAGQIFLAELMNGGALIRANVERVNGVYQGACFPFWGPGLVGPLVLAFDTRGRLYVGSITMPGWMGQPDRGALFRIEFTGETPFEMQSIHIRPRGFQVRFTQPVLAESASSPEAWRIDHYRYEYTPAYGSPELDRRPLSIERVGLSADGRAADLTTGALERGRVYAITLKRGRSATGEAAVHSTGVYTLNEIP